MRKGFGEPVITRADVAMHNTPSNIYVIVEGTVRSFRVRTCSSRPCEAFVQICITITDRSCILKSVDGLVFTVWRVVRGSKNVFGMGGPALMYSQAHKEEGKEGSFASNFLHSTTVVVHHVILFLLTCVYLFSQLEAVGSFFCHLFSRYFLVNSKNFWSCTTYTAHH